MVALFILFGFSTAIPLFNLLCALAFFMKFWLYKYIAIHYTGKTPAYSKDLILNIIKLLKAFLVMHNLYAIYFIGTPDIFPYSGS